MFNEMTIGYLFLGGSGAGAACVLAFLEIANIGRYGLLSGPVESGGVLARPLLFLRRRFNVPHVLLVYGWIAAFVCLVAGSFMLFLDLGRPERIWLLLFTTAPTVSTWGAWSLLGTTVCAGVFCIFAFIDHSRMRPTHVLFGCAIAIVSAMITMTYTGLLLRTFSSVLSYQTWMIPALFVLSSLSCGIVILMGASAFVETRVPFASSILRLARFDRALMVGEVLLIVFYTVWVINRQILGATADAMLVGDISAWLWGGVVVAGIGVPFALEACLRADSHHGQYLLIAGLVLAGGIMLRYCITQLSAYDPIFEMAYTSVDLPSLGGVESL